MQFLTELNDYTETDFHEYVKSLSTEALVDMKNLACDAYHNSGESGLSDNRYDELVQALSNRGICDNIGANVSEHETKVKLPYFMGSLNKIKVGQKEELARWVKKNTCDKYIVENKIDGVSCLLVIKGRIKKMYKRGDGTIGSDISHLYKYIKNIPKKVRDIVVRGELVMKRSVFNTKYANDFANPRNMVSGILGSKGVHKCIGDVNFLAYEIIGEEMTAKEQLFHLCLLNFDVVPHSILQNLSSEILEDLLVFKKGSSLYDMDGLVVHTGNLYERNTSGNPSYAFAFKNLSESAVTTVKKVEWNISRTGLIKPRVKVECVELGGVSISYATGFNAKYIRENSIGCGAIIEITRSGDVIPHIVHVIKGASEWDAPIIPYEWNNTGVDIIHISEYEGDISKKRVKELVYFFSDIGIKHFGEKTVEKLVEIGLNTIHKIVKANMDDFIRIKGFGTKSAQRLFDSIQEGMKDVKIEKLLSASGIFGFGFAERKIAVLLEKIPNLLQRQDDDFLLCDIMLIDGFSETSAAKIVNKLNDAKEFIKKLNIDISDIKESVDKNEKTDNQNDLSEMRAVFSGFRDEKLQKSIEAQGGKVLSAVSSKTTHLVVKDLTKCSGKIEAAEKKGIAIYEVNEFKLKFGL